MAGSAKRQRWIIYSFAFWSALALLITFRSIVLYHTVPQMMRPEAGEVSSDSHDLNSFVLKPSRTQIDFRNPRPAPQIHPYNSLQHDKSNATRKEEEFTVVILTHQRRKTQLPGILRNLIGLPGLRGVVMIWNGEKSTEDIKIQETPFPVQVLTNGRNSLNNRFLPLKIIETDAVLSMDDDMLPSHDSLTFAFRVWQEYRERIVGFPGRGVRWAKEHWVYDTAPCSVSMVLTGLAFFHKKYLSLYTYEMPAAIRERVDNVTNCEDIAMNFLVSHTTQKPPIKVTATEQWSCSGCNATAADSLWRHPKHFVERDACINFFAEVYGYMPLFKAEYRLDGFFENKAHCSRLNKKLPSTAYHVLILRIFCIPILYLPHRGGVSNSYLSHSDAVRRFCGLDPDDLELERDTLPPPT